MNTPTREKQLVDAFTTLADTLVVGYDVVDLLQSLVEDCRDILDVEAAGILLADATGRLEVVASTSEASNLVEILQVDAQAGPCWEAFTTGEIVRLPDLDAEPERWQRFRDEAHARGFRGVFAIPLRLRDDIIGTLNLLRVQTGDMSERDIRAARALGDVATIGILHERSHQDSAVVRRQLQSALDSRIAIEQAKGFIAYQNGVSPDQAFQLILAFARSHKIRLSEVATRLIEHTITLS
ncbi:GAF and ANTAR domain-containing protein [Frondihabitans cladoniiphilus]|uniref:GAF and ANTAR domain-containing protein n=1 Tax=Frondihabitans cladoniiphilus TaxID=715785 RepID=A0ABP8W632_9MICO